MLRRTAPFAVAALVMAGCTNWNLFKSQGADLVAAYAPRVSALLTTIQALSDRAAKLPADLPGVAEVRQKLATNKAALVALKATLDAFPGTLAAAIKAGKKAEVRQLLASLEANASGGVATVGAAVPGLTAEVARLEAEALKAVPTTYSKALATGFALTGNLTGIESHLVAFIEDASKPVDKTTWFDFDRLVFDTGSANLDMAQSKEQLVNVAEILKAYPAVKLKVGGYTDNQGSAATNKKLSAQRATNVARAIAGLGVKADRLDPEGYGAEHPVCAANDTDECRAQNRRISLRVTAK
jgi:outer membrane protein OmpA-like peptidoglycan-associated protein